MGCRDYGWRDYGGVGIMGRGIMGCMDYGWRDYGV